MRSLWWRLSVIAVLAAACPAAAQEAGKRGSERDRLSLPEYYRFRDLFQGRHAIADDDDRALLAKAARWYVYRLTWEEHHYDVGNATINDLVREAERHILPVDARKPASAAQQAFTRAYGKELQARLREVLRDERPIVRVNGMRLLCRLAEAGHEEAADLCLDRLQDRSENGGVKLYALRGLKHLLALGTVEQPVPKDADRAGKCVLALIDAIEAAPRLPADAEPEEVEGVRYVRREAIRALAHYPAPALEADKQIKGPTALVLLRVVAGAGLVPEPNLSERVEAAIGVCRLRPKLTPAYQADYAAHHLGKFAAAFASHYLHSRSQLADSGFPWKTSAARLHQALAEMAAHNAAPGIAAIKDQAAPLLAAIADGKTPASPLDLEAWLEAHPPAAGQLFKGLPQTVVHQPADPRTGSP